MTCPLWKWNRKDLLVINLMVLVNLCNLTFCHSSILFTCVTLSWHEKGCDTHPVGEKAVFTSETTVIKGFVWERSELLDCCRYESQQEKTTSCDKGPFKVVLFGLSNTAENRTERSELSGRLSLCSQSRNHYCTAACLVDLSRGGITHKHRQTDTHTHTHTMESVNKKPFFHTEADLMCPLGRPADFQDRGERAFMDFALEVSLTLLTTDQAWL